MNRTSVGTLPEVTTAAVRKPVNAPVTGVTAPSAFGANWGDLFVGAGYQNNLPLFISFQPRSSPKSNQRMFA